MKWHVCVPALIAIGFGAVAPAQGAQDDDRRALIQALRLAKTERAALKRLSATLPQTASQLAPCFDRVATDERLETELLPVIAASVPTPDRARPILAFLATSAGRKFSAAVERSDPQFKPALLRPMILPGGVPMSGNELTTGELRDIDAFFRSDQGAPLLAILEETVGFAQLTRTLSLRETFAAECGIDVR